MEHTERRKLLLVVAAVATVVLTLLILALATVHIADTHVGKYEWANDRSKLVILAANVGNRYWTDD